ncbi:MAG: hypothetical protein ABI687_13815, partial [Flavitalea sp.]
MKTNPIKLCVLWRAFIELPEKNGFPPTLGYVVWALTMVPAAIYALKLQNWTLQKDKRTILLGMIVGLLGAVGQLVLFFAIRIAPTYLVFPVIALTPLV